jgi:uncharacterized protein YjbI with pentapeptide repeats
MGDDLEFKNGFALIVGVGEYDVKNLSVNATANDAEEIEKVLTDPDFCAYPKDQVKRLVNGTATKGKIIAELEELYLKTQKAFNATVIIFLAGHGYLDEKKKQYYFLPHDVEANLREKSESKDLQDIESVDVSTAISSGELMERFRKLSDLQSVKRLVIFCHTCYSGSLGTPLSAETPATFSFKPIPITVYDELTRGAGRCIVSSSRPNQESWIKKGSEHSIFGKQLIAGLKGEGSSANETVVRILDLCYFLSITVKHEAKKLIGEDQVPVFSLYQSENFSVARKSGGETNYCLKLHLFLVRHLSLDELKVLSFAFNVPSDQIQDRDISSLALELIRQSAKSGGLRALVRMLRQNRLEDLEQLPDDKISPEMNKEYDQYLKMVEDNIEAKKIAGFRTELEKWLLENDLRNAKTEDPIRVIATQKTRKILRGLNNIGKSEIMRMLYDYKLIGENKPISLQEVDLTGVSLNSFDFTGFDLQGAVLNRANLSRTNLKGANLTKAKLNEAELGGVQLQDAVLREVELENANLKDADLTNANLEGAKLKGVDMSGVRLQNEITTNETDLKNANPNGAVLNRANLNCAILKGADLRGVQLRNAKMHLANLENVNLNNADLSEADLSEANLTNARLQGSNTKLNKTNFYKAVLVNADLTGADIYRIKLNEAKMDGTKLDEKWDLIRKLLNRNQSLSEDTGIDLTGADLSDANLNDMNFKGQNLKDVTFAGSSLLRADFSKANLDETDFQNATLITVSFVNSMFHSVANSFISTFRPRKDRKFMDTIVLGSNQADFTEATLHKVNLHAAKVSPKQLWEAKEIEDTKMPKDTEPWSLPPGPGGRDVV